MALLLVFLLGAMLISFLCSILEATLMSTPISYITMKEEENYRPATLMKEYKTNSSKPLAAILSLNTIANTIGAAGVGQQANILFGSHWFGLVSALTTILILVFSEIIPKTIGTTYWRSLMGFAAKMIQILIFCLYPIVICVEGLQKLISPKDHDSSVSKEEVGALADVAEESGQLDEDENEVIQNIISLDEMTVTDVMTPRVVAATAPESMTLRDFYKDKRYFHHSRIPVWQDNDDYITGYILRLEALQLLAEDKFDIRLGEIRRDIASFPEDTPLDAVWDEMLTKDEQISIVIDEYGSFQGIVTLEDVIETILGDEIVDERDEVRDMQQLAIEKWNKRLGQRAALKAQQKAAKPAAPSAE